MTKDISGLGALDGFQAVFEEVEAHAFADEIGAGGVDVGSSTTWFIRMMNVAAPLCIAITTAASLINGPMRAKTVEASDSVAEHVLSMSDDNDEAAILEVRQLADAGINAWLSALPKDDVRGWVDQDSAVSIRWTGDGFERSKRA